MEVLPDDDNETYVKHLYFLIIAWTIVTLTIGVLAAALTL